MRVLLYYLLPLLAPLLLYLAYVLLVRGRSPGWLRDGPWLWLTLAGVGCLVVSLVSWALLGGADAGRVYVPPRIEDGRVVPGHHLPAIERPDDG